jgi:hypothetical protein
MRPTTLQIRIILNEQFGACSPGHPVGADPVSNASADLQLQAAGGVMQSGAQAALRGGLP